MLSVKKVRLYIANKETKTTFSIKKMGPYTSVQIWGFINIITQYKFGVL